METLTDLTFLQTFTGGNKDKIAKYVNMFLQACPEQLSKMNSLLTDHDYAGIRATAHALKPQITYMGMKSGEILIKEIELLAGEQKEVEKLPSLLEEFTTTCNSAMVELKAALSN